MDRSVSADYEPSALAALAIGARHARAADHDIATRIFEDVLHAVPKPHDTPVMRRTYIQLATLYRVLERYGDEVSLLETHCDQLS